MSVTETHKPISVSINISLLNCGKNMNSLTGIKKDFFIDQTRARVGSTSNSIDVDYVNERKAKLTVATAAAEKDTIEEQYAFREVGDKSLNMNCMDAELNVSSNRSGHVRCTATITDFDVQYDSTSARLRIWKNRNCTKEIKIICAEISLKFCVFNQASLVAVHTVYNSFYGHEYYLKKEETIEKDPSLEELQSETTVPKCPKRPKSKEESMIDYTTEEWNAYEHVKTLNNHQHTLDIHHKNQATAALYHIQPNTKVTLQLKTTSSSKIDGYWPYLILILCYKSPYLLMSNSFAYEDHGQIIRLIVETYNRLDETINTDEHPVSAKMLMEKQLP